MDMVVLKPDSNVQTITDSTELQKSNLWHLLAHHFFYIMTPDSLSTENRVSAVAPQIQK